MIDYAGISERARKESGSQLDVNVLYVNHYAKSGLLEEGGGAWAGYCEKHFSSGEAYAVSSDRR